MECHQDGTSSSCLLTHLQRHDGYRGRLSLTSYLLALITTTLTCECMCRGYVNTSAVKSAISFIDGDKGILRYRGYPIEQLAERSNFTEVSTSLNEPVMRERFEVNHLRSEVAHHL